MSATAIVVNCNVNCNRYILFPYCFKNSFSSYRLCDNVSRLNNIAVSSVPAKESVTIFFRNIRNGCYGFSVSVIMRLLCSCKCATVGIIRNTIMIHFHRTILIIDSQLVVANLCICTISFLIVKMKLTISCDFCVIYSR